MVSIFMRAMPELGLTTLEGLLPLARRIGASILLALPALACAAPLSVVNFEVQFGLQTYDLLHFARSALPWDITGIRGVLSASAVTGDLDSLSGSGVSPSGFSGLGTSALTWSFSAPLADGSYALTLAGSGPHAITDAANEALGGSAGFAQGFTVLFGDVDGNGVLDSADVDAVVAATSMPYSLFADINGDGMVNITDIALVRDAAASAAANAIPEPASVALLGCAFAAMGMARRRRVARR